MTYTIITGVCVAFIAFFALLDVWYFGLLPFFFLIFFFSQGFTDFKFHLPNAILGDKYGLYLLSLLIFFGSFGILSFLGLEGPWALWSLLLLSGILWISSYLIPYEDGKSLFKYALCLTGILLIFHQIFFWLSSGLLPLIWAILGTWILFFWGIVYWVSILTKVEEELEQYFYFLLMLLVMYGILSLIESRLWAFDLNLAFWWGILWGLFSLKYLPDEKYSREEKISLRRVLAGERILKRQEKAAFASLFNFLRSLKILPHFLQKALEWINVGLLIGVLSSYLWDWFHQAYVSAFAYWTGIVLFLINAFLLKKNQAFSLVSRFATALVINFSPYILLLNLWGSWLELIPWLITWNIGCGIASLYAKLPILKKYLKKADLVFRLITNLIAMLLNIILLLKEPISGQLLFSLIFIYVGIEGVLSYYALPVIASFDELEEKKWTQTPSIENLIDKEISPFL